MKAGFNSVAFLVTVYILIQEEKFKSFLFGVVLERSIDAEMWDKRVDKKFQVWILFLFLIQIEFWIWLGSYKL